MTSLRQLSLRQLPSRWPAIRTYNTHASKGGLANGPIRQISYSRPYRPHTEQEKAHLWAEFGRSDKLGWHIGHIKSLRSITSMLDLMDSPRRARLRCLCEIIYLEESAQLLIRAGMHEQRRGRVAHEVRRARAEMQYPTVIIDQAKDAQEAGSSERQRTSVKG